MEPVWSNLKRSLANLIKHNISQLTALVKTRLRRMQYRPGLLEGFLAEARPRPRTPSVTLTIEDAPMSSCVGGGLVEAPGVGVQGAVDDVG